LSSTRQLFAVSAICLIALALVTCMGGLGSGPSMGDHECINAQSARQTLQSGQWLIPHLAEIPWVRKTPLGIWAIAAVSWVVDNPAVAPVSELTARLPSALAGLANIMVVWWLASMMFGARTGLIAGFVSASCVATIFFARNAQADMLLTLFTTLSFACFWRAVLHPRPSKVFMLLFYAAFAGAMMAKAPLPLAIVGFSLAVYWFVTLALLNIDQGDAASQGAGLFRRFGSQVCQQCKQLTRLQLIPGVFLFVVLAGAWPLYVYWNVPNAMSLWKVEYLQRYQGSMSDRSQPFLYYIPLIFGLTVPFMLSIPEAIASPFLKRYRAQRNGLAFAFTWAAVGTLFLSSSSFKRPHYLLSVVPAYYLLLAPVIDRLFWGAIAVTSRVVQFACRFLPTVLACVAIVGGVLLQREYPAFLRVYIVIALLVFAAWAAACQAYARGQRTLSFSLLNVGVLVAIIIAWPAAGQHLEIDPELRGLIAGLRQHGVKPNDTLYWIEGRPNAEVEFYSEYHIQRLINELEMTELRRERGTVSAKVYRESEKRIRERLAEPQPVYFIMTAGHHGMMEYQTDIRSRILFKLSGFHKESGDELLVFTQPNARPLTATQPF